MRAAYRKGASSKISCQNQTSVCSKTAFANVRTVKTIKLLFKFVKHQRPILPDLETSISKIKNITHLKEVLHSQSLDWSVVKCQSNPSDGACKNSPDLMKAKLFSRFSCF